MSTTQIENHPKRRNQRIKDDAEFNALLNSHPEEARAALDQMANDLGRVIELSKPVSILFPKIATQHIPGILFLLHRMDEAAELAALLTKIHLEENDQPVTPEALETGVAQYINDDLLEAFIASNDGGAA